MENALGYTGLFKTSTNVKSIDLNSKLSRQSLKTLLRVPISEPGNGMFKLARRYLMKDGLK
jgi:hypothetical protein